MRIVTCVNGAHSELAENLLLSLKNLGLKKNLVIHCLDSESYDRLSAIHDSCVLFCENESSADCDYGTKEFNDLTMQKMLIHEKELDEGNSFLFTDVDVFFFRDPTQYLNEALEKHPQVNIIFTSDDPGTPLCSGFAYYKNTDDTKRVIRDTISSMNSGSGPDWWCDQNYIIDVIQQGWCTFGILPRSLFPNGSWLFNEGKELGDAYMMHANYVVGRKNKIDKLKEYGGWLLETV